MSERASSRFSATPSAPAGSGPSLTAPSARATETRLSRRFAELKAAGELGIIAYITAGDPSLAATEEIALALADAGAAAIELGVPFSDPVADGPTIQRASERALRAGATLAGVIEAARKIRALSAVPLVLFSYFNPILQMGLRKFAAAAAEAGVDGVLATDLTPEEAAEYREELGARNLDCIFLAAPTSTDARLERIASACSGFLYVISRMGVTGARESLPQDLPELIRRVRRCTNLPIAVGFGISQPAHLQGLAGFADAAVVGSALVAEIETGGSAAEGARRTGERIRALVSVGKAAPNR